MQRKLTNKGYLRFKVDKSGKNRFEHCVVWESYNGPIPAGMFIHHIDFNKTNNAIGNLQLVTPLEHKRLHQGCRIVNDVWEKPCSVCGEYKPCTSDFWYFSRGWINGKLCKKCFCKKSLDKRNQRIAAGWQRKKHVEK